MPIDDVTVSWAEAVSPFVTVARLRLPLQDIGGDDNFEKMDSTSMTPWRCTEDHRPLGNLQRARKEVYRQSSILRHHLNHQVRKEPKNLAEVFGDSPIRNRSNSSGGPSPPPNLSIAQPTAGRATSNRRTADGSMRGRPLR
jgi:hypothetical protein